MMRSRPRFAGPRREISLRCRTPERFLEKAREEGARVLRASVGEENRLTLRANGRDADALLALAERYSLNVLSDTPLRADPRDALADIAFTAAGFLACVVLLLALSARVWAIDARCPAGGSPEAALEALSRMGVAPGTAFPDADALADVLEGLCPQYAHVSARRRGVFLVLELYAKTTPPAIYEAAAERDLVSRFDAVIDEITVLSGQAAAKPGDVVRRGQTLILGMERETDDATRGIGALGSVMGYIWSYGEASSPAMEARRVYTGRTRVSAALSLFGLRLPLLSAEPFALFEQSEERLPVGGMFLPLQIRRSVSREYSVESAPTDSAQLLCALEAKALSEAISALPPDGEIVDKWVDYSMIRDNAWIARACVKALLPLVTTREALVRGAQEP